MSEPQHKGYDRDDFLSRHPGLVATVVTIAIGLTFVLLLAATSGHH